MPPGAGERRTVTVLFSDFSGFTTLSEQMDPEDVRDLVDELFNRFRTVIEGEGGTIDKFIGDAVMAVFGAPVAREDDPARAVRAGLAMQRELAAFNGRRELDLRMRVGIDTGPVLWIGVAGDRATAKGEAVGGAERLEAAARPGAVFVSPAVRRAARKAARFEGPVAGKSKKHAGPVEGFEAVEGAAGLDGERTEMPMAGREAELSRLVGAIQAGKGLFVVIEGDAGVGKSRLLAEVRRAALAANPGLWSAVGRASEVLPASPLSPLGDVVRAATGDASKDPVSSAAALAAGIEGSDLERENAAHLILFSTGTRVPGSRVTVLDGTRLQGETSAAWERWLSSLSRARPALLLLEDLQWADPPAIDLLAWLAARLPGCPVSIVATARPGASLPAGFSTMPLAELDREGVASLASSVIGAPAGDDVVAFLLEKTGGHAFYVDELAGFLREEGLVDGSPAHLVAEPGRLPEGLRGLLLARLDGLPADVRQALKGASVLGRAFWMRLLARLVERDVELSVGEAGRLSLVLRQPSSLLDGDQEFAFRHALLREAAYGLLTRRERERLHQLAACLIEDRLPAGGRRVRSLAAAHREAAGELDRAAQLWTEAAEDALRSGPPHEAAALAAEAVRVGGGIPARLARIRALHRCGKYSDAAASATALAALPDIPAEAVYRARALEAESRMYLGEFEAGLSAAKEAALAARTPIERLESMRLRVDLLGWLAKLEEAKGLAIRAVEEARELSAAGEPGAPLELAALLGTFGRTLGTLGDARSALESFREARAIQEAAGDELAATRCHANEGVTLMRLGDFRGASEALEAVIARLEAIGDHVAVAIAQGNLAATRKQMGDFKGALQLEESSLASRRQVGDRAGEGVILGNLSTTWFHLGDPAKAMEYALASAALARETGDRVTLSSSLANVGMLHEFTGNLDAALTVLTEALAIARASGLLPTIAGALNNLGALHIARRDWVNLAETQKESLQISRATSNPRSAGLSLISLACLASQQGDFAAAERQILEAHDLFVSIGDPAGSCQTRALLAEARDRLGGGEAALSEALAAERDAREHGGKLSLPVVLDVLANAWLRRGEAARALAAAQESLALRLETGERLGSIEARLVVAKARLAGGDRAGAVVDAREAERQARQFGLAVLADANALLADLRNVPPAPTS